MKITYFLWQTFLTDVCRGNKSEMSRRLKIQPSDFYKVEARFLSNGGIGTTCENLLSSLIESNISLDRLVQNYLCTKQGRPIDDIHICPEMKELDETRKQWKKNQWKLQYGCREFIGVLNQAAEQLETAICQEGRCPIANCNDPQQRKEKCQCSYLTASLKLAMELFDSERQMDT